MFESIQNRLQTLREDIKNLYPAQIDASEKSELPDDLKTVNMLSIALRVSGIFLGSMTMIALLKAISIPTCCLALCTLLLAHDSFVLGENISDLVPNLNSWQDVFKTFFNQLRRSNTSTTDLNNHLRKNTYIIGPLIDFFEMHVLSFRS